MEFLSIIFFSVAPFALFCSEGGNGLFLCPLFLILGAICKWISNGGIDEMHRPRVSSEEFWTIHFLDHYNSWRGNEKVNVTAEDSRRWADEVTRSNGGTPPSNERYEEIARANGIKTRKVRQVDEDRWNRIQVEKYRLMGELEKKYGWIGFRNKDKTRIYCPRLCIKPSRQALKGFIKVDPLRNQDPWTAILAEDEKMEAKKWIEEYEERLLREMNDYLENGVKVPTIEWHKNRGGWSVYSEYDVKYGFCRKRGE